MTNMHSIERLEKVIREFNKIRELVRQVGYKAPIDTEMEQHLLESKGIIARNLQPLIAELGNPQNLRMNIGVEDHPTPGIAEFNPYDPKDGFRYIPEVSLEAIDERMSDIVGRKNVHEEGVLRIWTGLNSGHQDNLRRFSFFCGQFPMEYAYHGVDRTKYGFLPEIIERLKRLRLQLILPSALYKEFESLPDEDVFGICELSLNGYKYTGPNSLPEHNKDIDITHGIILAVPAEKLTEIRAKFVIAQTKVPEVFRRAFS